MTGVELWWLGQAGFRLRDPAGGPIVFVDAFLNVQDDRAWQAPATAEDLAVADLVLCTHEHIDHFDRPTLAAAARVRGSRFTLVVPSPNVDDAIALGVPSGRVIGLQPGESIAVDGVEVTAVPARHGLTMRDAYSFGETADGLVRFLGYVVQVGGVRLYHSGDCIPYAGHAERLRALRPDLALLPINGRDFFRETELDLVGNMEPREAARLAADIGAHTLVPTHWEMFAPNRGFPGDLAAYVADAYPELTLLIMGRGRKIVVGPAGA
jgi:L-ascorbate metabolism protein UlaG (beta-lactamase superfamily)